MIRKKDKKIFISFLVIWFSMFIYFNILRNLLQHIMPLTISLFIDVLFLVCLCWYYFKQFGFSQFVLTKKETPILLKAVGLCILLYILISPLSFHSIKSFIVDNSLLFISLIDKEQLLVLLSKKRWLYLSATLLIAPITEEIVYRGLFQRCLERRGLAVWIVIIVPAILFTLSHLRLIDAHILFICGCFWGFIYYKYKNVFINILCHSIWNFLNLILVDDDRFRWVWLGIYLLAALLFILLLCKMNKDTLSNEMDY